MTSSDAREILKLQDEKRRTEIVKAAKQEQKIYKKTQATKRPHKTISKTLKLITSKDTLPENHRGPEKQESLRITLQLVTKAVIQRKVSSWKKERVNLRKNIFINRELWLQCDICECWLHAGCTNMRKHTKKQIDSLDL